MRLTYVDTARGLGICLVVIGHSTIPGWLDTGIRLFHMPLFFFIAGYLFNFGKHSGSFGAFARGKARRLLIPYLVSCVVFYLLWVTVGRHHLPASEGANPLVPLIGIAYGSALGQWLIFNRPLWFLVCLFCAEVFFWCFLKLAGRMGRLDRLLAVAAVSLGGCLLGQYADVPWGADTALAMQAFLYAGYAARQGRFFEKRNPAVVLPILAGCAACYAAAFAFNGVADTSQRVYGLVPLYYAGALAGTVLTMYLAMLVAAWRPAERVFSALGVQSLEIMIFHIPARYALHGMALVFPVLLESNAWALYPLWGLAVPCLGAAFVIRKVGTLRLLFTGAAPAQQA